jgi:endoglucanase
LREKRTGFLRVEGNRILDSNGQSVRLMGFNIGGWLNMEGFITGFLGTESGFRAAIKNELGEEKAHVFFESMLNNFIQESDIRYMASLGVTVIRVPLNYRHLEDDNLPFSIDKDGFVHLDRIINWCKAHNVRVILDLHAAQGWQNPDWHSDNPKRVVLLWSDETFVDRVRNTWVEIARRYKDEPAVAGYNVLNEPVSPNFKALNRVYAKIVGDIRKVDSDHLIFLEGNLFSTCFDELDPPFDRDLVYSCHNYTPPGFSKGPYPGRTNRIWYDLRKLGQDFENRRTCMSRNNVPNFVGEFGSIYWKNKYDRCRLRVVDDLLNVMDNYHDHWTIWTYKDIGMMGTLYANPGSPWMNRIQRMNAMKKKLGLDGWEPFAQESIFMRRTVGRIVDEIRRATNNAELPYQQLKLTLSNTLSVVVLADFLLPFYASQFKDMSFDEIERVMQSFRWDECVRRYGLEQILKNHLRR